MSTSRQTTMTRLMGFTRRTHQVLVLSSVVSSRGDPDLFLVADLYPRPTTSAPTGAPTFSPDTRLCVKNSTGPLTDSTGTVADGAGYMHGSSSCRFEIAPVGALSVFLQFTQAQLQSYYDRLSVYDQLTNGTLIYEVSYYGRQVRALMPEGYRYSSSVMGPYGLSNVTSYTGKMLVVYHSGDYYHRNAFAAEYAGGMSNLCLTVCIERSGALCKE